MTIPAQIHSPQSEPMPLLGRFVEAWAIIATLASAVLAKALPAIALTLSATGHAAERGFPVACGPEAQAIFDRRVEALDGAAPEWARGAFAETARIDPACPMAYWGLATADMGDLRTPPSAQQLARGAASIARAKALGGKTERECELIDAVAQFYHRHEVRTHDMRLVYYERALSRSRRIHAGDPEIARRHDHASKAAWRRAMERAEAAYRASR